MCIAGKDWKKEPWKTSVESLSPNVDFVMLFGCSSSPKAHFFSNQSVDSPVCPCFILKDPSVPRFPENEGICSEADWPCLRGSVALNLLNKIRNSTSLSSNVAEAHFCPDIIDPRAGHTSQSASVVQVVVVILSLVVGPSCSGLIVLRMWCCAVAGRRCISRVFHEPWLTWDWTEHSWSTLSRLLDSLNEWDSRFPKRGVSSCW
jgi:hypothetical protein